MPIYEYKCTNCDHSFDVMQKISDEPITLCPNCSQDTAVKLVSAAGFQLKGTGWYATDFKNKGKKPASEQSTKSNASDASSSAPDAKTSDSANSSASKTGETN